MCGLKFIGEVVGDVFAGNAGTTFRGWVEVKVASKLEVKRFQNVMLRILNLQLMASWKRWVEVVDEKVFVSWLHATVLGI